MARRASSKALTQENNISIVAIVLLNQAHNHLLYYDESVRKKGSKTKRRTQPL